MSRLLHAAARGARIQLLQKTGEWTDARLVWIGDLASDPNTDRIHPDDAHLAYGPISTALRKRAETGFLMTAGLPYIKGDFLTHEETLMFLYDETFDVVFFLLILAESLADEGL